MKASSVRIDGVKIDDAVHLTHGDAAAEAIRRLGAKAILVRRDLLTVGPCDADPERHRALRIGHWKIAEDAEGFLGARELAAAVAGLPAAQPIVLWASSAWSDQLSLWWALDALAHADLARLWLAEPLTDAPLSSAGGASAEQLQSALATARPISPALAQQGAGLWRKFAAPSPLAFDEARRAGAAELPRLAKSADPHGDYFPARDGGRLRLAALDERLLSQMSDEWQSAAQLVKQAWRDLERVILPHGDRFVLARLDAWADHGGVERRKERDGDRWSSIDFRLAEPARRLLTDGPDEVSQLHHSGWAAVW